MSEEWHRDGYVVSTDAERLDLEVVHAFLVESYWAQGIPRETVERSIEGSMPFGLYAASGEQVGFARVVSDRATFAWIGDVFVLPDHRGKGLALWLMECVRDHPALQGLRRWMLATRDAHDLYARVGFTPLADPTRLMERAYPGLYLRDAKRD